jgi:hypothetical protein
MKAEAVRPALLALFHVESPLAATVLREGERTLSLKVKKRQFELPLYDTSWGNDAVVDLAFVAPEGAAP